MCQEQRQSFRIRIPEELEQAVLRVGGKTVKVRLVDESAGGFSIAVGHKIQAAPGDTLRLRTAAGWHEVRLIHSLICDEGVLIGLVRLHDLEDPRHSQPQILTRAPIGAFACIGFGIVLMIFVVNSLARYAPATRGGVVVSPNGAASTMTRRVLETQKSLLDMASSGSRTTPPSN